MVFPQIRLLTDSASDVVPKKNRIMGMMTVMMDTLINLCFIVSGWSLQCESLEISKIEMKS